VGACVEKALLFVDKPGLSVDELVRFVDSPQVAVEGRWEIRISNNRAVLSGARASGLPPIHRVTVRR
jgi:hypothetical protein